MELPEMEEPENIQREMFQQPIVESASNIKLRLKGPSQSAYELSVEMPFN